MHNPQQTMHSFVHSLQSDPGATVGCDTSLGASALTKTDLLLWIA